jgi:hypothetical protein
MSYSVLSLQLFGSASAIQATALCWVSATDQQDGEQATTQQGKILSRPTKASQFRALLYTDLFRNYVQPVEDIDWFDGQMFKSRRS